MLACKKCKKSFETHEKCLTITCNGPCLGYFHYVCTNLDKNEMPSLKLSTNIKWFCDDCSKSLGGIKHDGIVDIQDAVKSPKKRIGRRIQIVVFVVFVILVLFIKRLLIINKNSTYPTIDPNYITKSNMLHIKKRNSWLAQPSVNDLVPLNHPIQRVIVLPTRTSECKNEATCTYTVRITQTYNIESMLQDDIIYNFLIGGDGNVYEGRGWNYKGSILKDVNDDSIIIAFIGSFKKQPPANNQLNATRSLLQMGINLKKISPNYKIIGVNQLETNSSATMADALYKSFENWPNWSD